MAHRFSLTVHWGLSRFSRREQRRHGNRLFRRENGTVPLMLRLAAALLLPAVLPAGTVRAQDCVNDGRECAKTWAMHRIAVIQAAAGDVQGAKRTVSQIDEDGEKGPSDVTAVWFCDGQPVYDHPPAPAGCAGCNHRAFPVFFGGERAAEHVPAQVPPGLPANYLDGDPRHGAVVEFADERDSQGTRITSRTYADGYAVIETPHAASQVK